MNSHAIHFSAHVISWIDHEEEMLLRLAKRVELNYDRIIVPIIGIGLCAWVLTLFLSVFIRYNECAKIIALCSR